MWLSYDNTSEMDHQPPGSSLFQGVESIKLNNDLQRIEEEDAIEDRLRRNEEVSNSVFMFFFCENFDLQMEFSSTLIFR